MKIVSACTATESDNFSLVLTGLDDFIISAMTTLLLAITTFVGGVIKRADYAHNGCGIGVDYKYWLVLINNHMQKQ